MSEMRFLLVLAFVLVVVLISVIVLGLPLVLLLAAYHSVRLQVERIRFSSITPLADCRAVAMRSGAKASFSRMETGAVLWLTPTTNIDMQIVYATHNNKFSEWRIF